MGLTYAEITLSNPRDPQLEALTVLALADTGAMMLCIPPRVADRLQLESEDVRRVVLANGASVTVPYAGPVQVRFGDRFCFVGAYVLGEEVVLGAVPMEDMDLVVSPLTRTVEINPHPNVHMI